jgi:hypothetical protein
MIITNQKYKTQPNGKSSYRGFINISKDIASRLGSEEKEITVIILQDGEELTVESFQSNLAKMNRFISLKQEMAKLQKEMGGQ